MHCSSDDPPNTTMLMKAGGITPYQERSVQQSPIAQALMEATAAIGTAFSPKPHMQFCWGLSILVLLCFA